jgi:hypothetical protein
MVRRRHREIAFLVPGLVALVPALFDLPGVPGSLFGIEEVVAGVLVLTEPYVVKDVELRFGAPEGGLGDTGACQVVLRLRGKGAPGSMGGPAGDLLVRIRVASSNLFGRDGNNLTLKVPITYTEAALGTKIEVPTLNGGVKLKVPAGTPSGKTFRVKGRGVQPETGRPGDLLVTVQVAVPTKVSKDEKKLLEQLDAENTENVREHLKG